MIKLSKELRLVSNSPRRQSLLKDAGYNFTVSPANIDENYPPAMDVREVAKHLAKKKAIALSGSYQEDIILAADTTVIYKNRILDKPINEAHACETLRQLSGTTHEVITGLAFICDNQLSIFHDSCKVYFNHLEEWEINHYVQNFKPYDKAGGYGIQEWIGLVGIGKIEGSFYNVMGLPVHLVHEYLKQFREPING